MYLISEDGRPFAIVEELTGSRLEKAIEEEFSYKDIAIDDFINPDWCDVAVVSYEGIGQDEEDEVNGEVEIIRLVKY